MTNEIRDRLAELGWTLVSERPAAERVTRRNSAGDALEVEPTTAHFRAEKNVDGRVRNLSASSREELLKQAEAAGNS
jgi:hypothetical protein